MEKYWILFVVLYSVFKSARDGMKKAALKRNTSLEILFFYTLIGFILIIPFSKNVFSLEPRYYYYIAIKSLVVGSAWLFAFKALQNMSVSHYGIMDLYSVLFSTLLGVSILGETMTVPRVLGLILVVIGLLLVNRRNHANEKKLSATVLFAALASCFLNAISGTMDKILMQNVEAGQLQFWFMFYMLIMYSTYILASRTKLNVKTLIKNYWVYIMSIVFVIGDRLLFIANASPYSKVTVMTIIKQSSVLVTILIGWAFFKDKNIRYKAFCALIVLAGIVIATAVR
ncbi:MAG: EamA family transporter [Clostridia bacterium]|nr:EamA family transporter [Clostridia bacterium]MDD6307910.1 EamA family transporter [Clostridia bacterium]